MVQFDRRRWTRGPPVGDGCMGSEEVSVACSTGREAGSVDWRRRRRCTRGAAGAGREEPAARSGGVGAVRSAGGFGSAPRRGPPAGRAGGFGATRLGESGAGGG